MAMLMIDCDRSSGRSRIGTETAATLTRSINCDRSSGRSRIGTASKSTWEALRLRLRSFFGAIEDWNQSLKALGHSQTQIAIVLRGDRGLEQNYHHYNKTRGQGLRSFFGAIEDWNSPASNRSVNSNATAIVLRGDRGLELKLVRCVWRKPLELRSFFGAIEDWNLQWE